MSVEQPAPEYSLTKEIESPSQILLAFGQGPIIDRVNRIKAQDANVDPAFADANFWSHTIADAAAILYEQNQADTIIVMGGKTGGPTYASEAELIGNDIKSKDVPEQSVLHESGSTNTLENIANVVNLYLDRPEYKNAQISVLGADYHTPRIKLLMKLFEVQTKEVFSSEQVLKYAARDPIHYQPNDKLLDEMEQRLDVNSAGRISNQIEEKLDHEKQATYYDKKTGTETKTVMRRIKEEDVFTRWLLEQPGYWVGYLGLLNNDMRMINTLHQVDKMFPNALKDTFNIDLDSMSADMIRKQLVPFTTNSKTNPAGKRVLWDNIDDEIGKPWSTEAIERYNLFLEPHERL